MINKTRLQTFCETVSKTKQVSKQLDAANTRLENLPYRYRGEILQVLLRGARARVKRLEGRLAELEALKATMREDIKNDPGFLSLLEHFGALPDTT